MPYQSLQQTAGKKFGLGTYRAERILDFFVKTLGPSVYNQAIQDARKFMLERLEDLDTEFYGAEDLR